MVSNLLADCNAVADQGSPYPTRSILQVESTSSFFSFSCPQSNKPAKIPIMPRKSKVTRTLTEGRRDPAPDTVSLGSRGWQFINLSHMNSAKDPATRKVIRANAMLHYRRNRREGMKQLSDGPALSSSPCDTLCKPVTFPKLGQYDEEQNNLPSFEESPKQSHNWDQITDAAREIRRPQIPKRSSANKYAISRQWEEYQDIRHSCLERTVASQSWSISASSLICNNNCDPFDSLPTNHCPRGLELLRHCEQSNLHLSHAVPA